MSWLKASTLHACASIDLRRRVRTSEATRTLTWHSTSHFKSAKYESAIRHAKQGIRDADFKGPLWVGFMTTIQCNRLLCTIIWLSSF